MIIQTFHQFFCHPSRQQWDGNSSHLTLDFEPLSLPLWRDLCERVVRLPLTQSYEYAYALAATSSLRPKWAVIREQKSGEAIGIVQIIESRFWGENVQAVIIDRGPVWFRIPEKIEHIKSFWQAIDQKYPARLWRWRRFIPEQETSTYNTIDFSSLGFLPRLNLKPYQTIWMDLTKPLDQLRIGLRKNWRQYLTRANKNPDLCIQHTHSPAIARDILSASMRDAQVRGYPLPPQRLVEKMIDIFSKNNGLHVFIARECGRNIAGAIVFEHGLSATWQIGFVSGCGRRLHANNRLIFEMMRVLQQRGITSLDLGGVNDENAKGVSVFKSGLGGDHVTLVGAFK